ncbi:protein asteroid homolog 1-like [Triplophysa dalaica]|uniref:protein asteroid homolog 1-like n=1 Tax=Triplophysa dalaica TaxID=1582913 RepID=UPI0024DF968D|nr:protein asteroid homolog 1-like [Triplophysa dalaica]
MGVHGLKSYIESNKDFLKDFSFRDSKLIIDGCNLYHDLYSYFQLDHKHGGEYDTFKDSIKTFFTNLKDCDIKPYVVLDGGADHTDKKLETLKERNQEQIRSAHNLSEGRRGRCPPLLNKNVFRQTLRELKVPFVQCLEEADWEIAALAKQWNCPVLSNDSDFYIFDLPAGVFPTVCFCWNNTKVNSQKKRYIPTRHFTVERFCASFNNMNKVLLPVFACLLGNDYTNLQNIDRWERHSNGAGKFERFDGLLSWLSKSQSQNQAIHRVLELIRNRKKKEKVCEALLEGVKEYEITGGCLAQFFDSKTPTPCTGPLRALPTWTVRQLFEGNMVSMLVDVFVLKRVMLKPQVEDFTCTSSSETSRPIRQVIYGLILLGKQQTAEKCYVEEFDRKRFSLESSEVEAIGTSVKEGLQLETLWTEPIKLRLQVFLEAFGVPSVTFRGIPLDLQLQVFVTRFWLVNAQPRPNLLHLWGLLLGMVHGRLCNKPNTQTDTQWRFKCQGRIHFDREAAHLYSQWQSCLNWGLFLNCLLCLPLPEPECAELYRGTLVHKVFQELKRGIRPESMLVRGSNAEHLFRQLKEAVLSLVDEDDMKRISDSVIHRSVAKTHRDQRSQNWSADELSSYFEDMMDEHTEDCYNKEVNGEERKAKGYEADKTECSYPIRTRHKAKERNSKYPCKKFERGCFE